MAGEKIPNLSLYSDEPVTAQLGFDVQPIVEQLVSIVTTCPTPFHIGVFAPWGAGKSTVLDALAREVKAPVRIVRLNAWKYRNDSFRRKFLLTVAQELNPESRDTLKRRMYSIVTGLNDKTTWRLKDVTDRKWWQRLWVQIRTPVFITVGVLLLVLLTAFLQALIVTRGLIWNAKGLWLWLEKVEGYLGAPLLTLLITTGLNALGKVYIENDANLQLTNQEQFEEQFLQSLEKLKVNERVLILVDELDRCSPAQVLEALETVKTFMNAPRCVFVLACDRGVVEDAVARTAELAGWRASKYLEKIFQLAIYLPPVHAGGMMHYAEELIGQSVEPGNQALARAIRASRVLEILIRPGVTTPRRAKRLLNDFLVRYSLAGRREQGWQEERLTDDLPFLAKMSVIMSEFAYFLEALSANADLMRWLNQVRRGKAAELEPYQVKACSVFFGANPDGTPDWENPLPEHSDLIQFLGQTWQFDADGEKVRRHLYLGRDPEGATVGDTFLHEVLAMAEAGQVQPLKLRVAQSKSPDAVLGFLARQVKLARGILQQNLLLSLLELAEYASPGADGARLAASVLGAYGEQVSTAQLAQEVPPMAVMPYVGMMERSAQRQWLATTLQWLREDPAARGGALFDRQTLPYLAGLAPHAPKEVSSFLWEWLQTPAGQAAFLSRIPDLPDEVNPADLKAVLLPLLPHLIDWLRSGRDGGSPTRAFTPNQEAVLRVWLEILGVESLLDGHGQMFWDLMLVLLRPYPAVGRDWVVPLLCEHFERIPDSYAEPLLTGVIFAQDKTSTPEIWRYVLLLAGSMLAKHGSGAVDAGATLAMSALLDNGVPTVGLGPIAELVTRHWAVWAPDSQNKFVARLMRTAQPAAPVESILEVLTLVGSFPLSSSLAVSLFDALIAHLADEEQEQAANGGVHRLLRSVPLRLLADRLERIQGFLVNESHLDDVLRTLDAMARRSDELDYVAVVLRWAEALAGYPTELAALVQWVKVNQDVCPLSALQDAVDHQTQAAEFLTLLPAPTTVRRG